jgi:hypothetical protein
MMVRTDPQCSQDFNHKFVQAFFVICPIAVLAPQRQNQVQGKNGQDSIERWEQELRASLEQKKAGGAKILTKAEKALVDAQLSKEADVRAQVTEALAKLKHGFCLIHSLMQARKASENVITDYAASLVDICLKALQLEVVSLIPTEGFVAFSVSTMLL